MQLERIKLCHAATLEAGRGVLHGMLSAMNFSIRGSVCFQFFTVRLRRESDALVWTSELVCVFLIRVAVNG